MVGAGGLPSPRRLELLPFPLARRSQFANSPGAEHALEAGLNARLGIGSGATLAATVNPDFGQVELDPAVLNLTVFETFFPEKRPFFLEDGRVFVPPYPLFQLFHSRRIGQKPGRYSVQPTDVTRTLRLAIRGHVLPSARFRGCAHLRGHDRGRTDHVGISTIPSR